QGNRPPHAWADRVTRRQHRPGVSHGGLSVASRLQRLARVGDGQSGIRGKRSVGRRSPGDKAPGAPFPFLLSRSRNPPVAPAAPTAPRVPAFGPALAFEPACLATADCQGFRLPGEIICPVVLGSSPSYTFNNLLISWRAASPTSCRQN